MRGRTRGRGVGGSGLVGGLLLWQLSGLLGGPRLAQAETITATPAPASRSVLEPSYDVLLPDPEPQVEAQKPGTTAEPERSTDIDIADRVLSAAKQVTTVQEAPSIISVIRSDEIASRGYRNINQVLDTIPGWLTATGQGNHLPFPLVRGTGQAALLLRDGVSMFEPVLNASSFNRSLPLV